MCLRFYDTYEVKTRRERLLGMKKKNVVVVGLQRSGTTFLEQLLLQNTEEVVIVNTPKTGFHKHIYGREVLRAIVEKKIYILLIYKHPYSWIDSIYRKKVNICKVYPEVRIDKRIDPAKLANLYQRFYYWWLPLCDYQVPYEELIRNPAYTKMFLQQIQHDLEVEKSRWGDIIIPEEVKQSAPFTNCDRKRYQQVGVEYKKLFSWERVAAINKELKHYLLGKMGYRLCETKQDYYQWTVLKRGDKLLGGNYG